MALQFACGAWYGVQWDQLLGKSPWGAPLDVVQIIGFVITPLELAHKAQVRWGPLDLSGLVWDVVSWAASACYFSSLENDGAELEKSTGWKRKVLVYYRRNSKWKRSHKGM